MKDLPIVLPFSKIDKEDVAIVGGKCANLGEMTRAGFPVPQGYAITVEAYDRFLEEGSLGERIYALLKGIDVEKVEELDQASRKIQKLINSATISPEVAKQIVSAYKKMSGVLNSALVAVRSSATAEDAPGTSFAGQQATLLNVKGENNLLSAVKECWASLFTQRSIYYRTQAKIAHRNVKISVAVQKMVRSEVSGVMFTINPVTNEKDRIVVDAVWGLGEYIVQGLVIPDHYVVQKETFEILSKEISDQKVQLLRSPDGNSEVAVPASKRDKQKITDEEVKTIAKLGSKLQEHYYFPQDVEWAKEGNKLYIVQTRPITTIADIKKKQDEKNGFTVTTAPVLHGASASPGIGSGPVKVVKSPKEIDKVKSGDVLVAPMTSPDFVPAMKKAAAIITDEGGLTSHAAIVSRELGVPCIVGTKTATKTLKDGVVVTVDGKEGNVYLGAAAKSTTKKDVKNEPKPTRRKTATRVYVNLAEVSRAKEVAKEHVEGVGLLRAEFMIAGIGIHPKEAIKKKKRAAFIKHLARDLTVFCKEFYPRPVVYRSTDFKTNEYRSLPGGAAWEPNEANPMLGYRGAFRYISDPEVFTLELEAIELVRQKYDNLWLMIPFVRSPEELSRVRRLVASSGLFGSPTFKFWMMVEIPVNVILINKFIDVGIDGVSIGANDLTMLVTGTDRDNATVAQEFDERSPAVKWALRRVIRACNARGISASICGQAPSEYDDLVEKLVRWGITSISVNPDSINRVRNVIAATEEKILKGE